MDSFVHGYVFFVLFLCFVLFSLMFIYIRLIKRLYKSY